MKKRADGRYQRSYTGSDGRRHYVYAATRREVDDLLSQALRDKELGLFVGGPSQTVEQYLVAWLRSSRDRVRDTTLARYEGQLRRHVIPAIGGISLRKLQPQHISDLYQSLRGENHGEDRDRGSRAGDQGAQQGKGDIDRDGREFRRDVAAHRSGDGHQRRGTAAPARRAARPLRESGWSGVTPEQGRGDE